MLDPVELAVTVTGRKRDVCACKCPECYRYITAVFSKFNIAKLTQFS